MKRLITVDITERGVINVDVSDEAARKMSAAGFHRTYSTASQVQATANILNTLGMRVPVGEVEVEHPVLGTIAQVDGGLRSMHVRGKRGVNNSGWTAVVYPNRS